MNKKSILQGIFGHKTFRDGQEKIIDHVMECKETLVLLPTGAGKSLCYQLPALLLPGTTIVVSPLLSLMRDQVQALQEKGVEAEYLGSDGGSSAIHEIRNSPPKILYVSPEKVNTFLFQNLCQNWEISLIVFDEAHCIVQWGNDFRPEYGQSGTLLRQLWPDSKVLALTATATDDTISAIAKSLRLDRPRLFRGHFYRKNLDLSVVPKDEVQLMLTFDNFHEGAAIIYVRTRKEVDQIVRLLKSKSISAKGYHGGMTARTRQSVQDYFRNNIRPVIVATIAFGMGIDRGDVRLVIHWGLPAGLTNYYQEIGRAGRDGMTSRCLLFWAGKDFALNNFLIQKSEGTQIHKTGMMIELEKMRGFAEGAYCRHGSLQIHFGDTPVDHCGHCDICRTSVSGIDFTEYLLIILDRLYKGNISYYQLKDLIDETIPPTPGSKILSGIIKRQILAREFLKIDLNLGGQLKLSEQSLPYLEGNKKLIVSTEETPKGKAKIQIHRQGGGDLLENLKDWRTKEAKRRRTQAFKILHDRSLEELAQIRPNSQKELLEIYGIGLAKAKKFGPKILEIIKS